MAPRQHSQGSRLISCFPLYYNREKLLLQCGGFEACVRSNLPTSSFTISTKKQAQVVFKPNPGASTHSESCFTLLPFSPSYILQLLYYHNIPYHTILDQTSLSSYKGNLCMFTHLHCKVKMGREAEHIQGPAFYGPNLHFVPKM